MEQAIKNEEERYRTTLLSVGDGVISTDEQGNITVMNPIAEKLTGWTQKEAAGRPFSTVFNIIDDKTRKACDNPVHIVLNTAESYKSPGTILLVSKSGKETPVENNAAPIKNNTGRITGAVIVFRDFTEYRERQKKIEYLSFHDPLTGLYNRRFMEDTVRSADEKNNLPITVMVFDVNGLKLTNDAFGHNMGDCLLVTVANILRDCCKPGSIIARMGGDEFDLHAQNRRGQGRGHQAENHQNGRGGQAGINYRFSGNRLCREEMSLDNLENIMMDADNQMYREKLRFGKTMRSQTIETVLRTINYKYDREQVHAERVSRIASHRQGRRAQRKGSQRR
jgi:diguanylate cyclase (GGDEF)-like protein/PAS domain S-box-containing protein